MLLQKLFLLSLLVSMIISPNGLKDLFRRLLRKEPPSKDMELEEKIEEDTKTIEDDLAFLKAFQLGIEEEPLATSSHSRGSAMMLPMGSSRMEDSLNPSEKIEEDTKTNEDDLAFLKSFQLGMEEEPLAMSSHSRGSAMMLPMGPYQSKVARKPLDSIEKKRLRQKQYARHKKPKEQELMKEKIEEDTKTNEDDLTFLKAFQHGMEEEPLKAITLKRHKHSPKYTSVSKPELAILIEDAGSEYEEDNQRFVLRITDVDEKFEKYKRENQDRPILLRSINRFIKYENEKGNPL